MEECIEIAAVGEGGHSTCSIVWSLFFQDGLRYQVPVFFCMPRRRFLSSGFGGTTWASRGGERRSGWVGG